MHCFDEFEFANKHEIDQETVLGVKAKIQKKNSSRQTKVD